MFLVEVVIIVIVVIRPRLNCCLGREVLLLRRCGYRVIAFAGGRKGGGVRTNAELEGGSI